MTDSKALFLHTSPVRLFFTAAVPGIVSMLASALYGLFDGIFVGRMLGETAFAAVNLAFPFVIINFSLADLIGVGSSVPISIALGRRQEAQANNIFSCACLMIVGAGAAIGAALYAAAPGLLRLLGADGTLAELAVQYVRVYALCSPLTTVVFALDNYLRISGQVRLSMWLNVLMSALTAALEFVFLFVLRWGVWGAALATCAGMMVAAGIGIVPFLKGRLQLRFCRPRFSPAMTRQIISCGTPNFLSNIAGRVTSILMNTMLLRMGGESAVAIYGILMYVGDVVQPMLYGVCDSLQPAIGYNWGAERYDRVKRIVRCCFIAGALISLVAAAVLCAFPARLVSLFIADADAAFMDTAVFAMRLFSIAHLTRWFSFAVQSYMTAVDRPKQASAISVSTALIFPVVLIAALYPVGLTGLWLNFGVTSALAAVLAGAILARFRRTLTRAEKPA